MTSVHWVHTHTHTRLTTHFLGLPRWAGTRKVKPIWILLKQETASGSGISWAICKSASCSIQITTSATHYWVFYRLDALPATQPTASKHWRDYTPDSVTRADMSFDKFLCVCCNVFDTRCQRLQRTWIWSFKRLFLYESELHDLLKRLSVSLCLYSCGCGMVDREQKACGRCWIKQ